MEGRGDKARKEERAGLYNHGLEMDRLLLGIVDVKGYKQRNGSLRWKAGSNLDHLLTSCLLPQRH